MKRNLVSYIVLGVLCAILFFVVTHHDRIHYGLLNNTYTEENECDTLHVLLFYHASDYFVYRGSPIGFQYDMLKHMAKDMGKEIVSYMQVNNTPISDFAVSFGLGLPFKTFNSKCALNLMFEYGSMGSTKNNLIRQNYFQIGLNLILVERWYQRVKLE